MIFKRFYLFISCYLPCSVVAVVPLGQTGCTLDSAMGLDDVDAATAGEIVVKPEDFIVVGYLERRTVNVTVLDSSGVPMVNQPVSASFIGPAHNGDLFPAEFFTDERGGGAVEFTAPSQTSNLADLSFQIRFSSPLIREAAFLTVEVDPDRFSILTRAVYSGDRELTSINAAIYRDITCDYLAESPFVEPVEVLSEATLPSQFEFWGLWAELTYAVMIQGNNSQGELRASRCRDGLVPSETSSIIELLDLPLSVIGLFEVGLQIRAESAQSQAQLAVPVDEVFAVIESFDNDKSTQILDALHDTLNAEDSLAAQNFNQIRADQQLDTALTQDFIDREVDISASLSLIPGKIKGQLAEMNARGTMEFTSPDEHGKIEVHHQIKDLSFGGADDDVYSLPNIEPGQGTSSIDEADVNLLNIDEFYVSVELGDVLGFLYQLQFDNEPLATAVEQIIECDKVADFLEGYLTSVTDLTTIRIGCQSALQKLEEQVEYQQSQISKLYSVLSFSGTCSLVDPLTGDIVSGLTQGMLETYWQANELLPRDALPEVIGPLNTTFEATLSGATR